MKNWEINLLHKYKKILLNLRSRMQVTKSYTLGPRTGWLHVRWSCTGHARSGLIFEQSGNIIWRIFYIFTSFIINACHFIVFFEQITVCRLYISSWVREYLTKKEKYFITSINNYELYHEQKMNTNRGKLTQNERYINSIL